MGETGNIASVAGHNLRSRLGGNRHDGGVCDITGARPAEELSNMIVDQRKPVVARALSV
jgi:hypothetical protein